MQALFTHALRQTQSINSDLALLEASFNGLSSASPYDGPNSSNLQGNGIDSAGLNGQIVASLAALQRTVDDYESMAKRELVDANKAKSALRSERIRNDYTELRKRYDSVKTAQASQRANADRAALFSTGSSGQYTNGSAGMQQRRVPQSPALGSNESPFSMPARATLHTSALGRAGTRSIYAPRTNAALDEHSFINDTGSQLDSFIAQGQAVLGNLTGQRDMLKGTQRRLLSAANTLGLSRSTIQFIERRSKGDMVVFIIGSIFTFISFILILRYFG